MGRVIEGYLNLSQVQGDFLLTLIERGLNDLEIVSELGGVLEGVTRDHLERELFDLSDQLKAYGFKAQLE